MTTQLAEGAEGIEMIEPMDGLRLELPPEPAELRATLREKALEASRPESSAFENCFAAWTWERWRSTLEPAGMGREEFIDLVVGYRREVWFWLLGDRGWEQLVSGLAGRVSRRLPAR